MAWRLAKSLDKLRGEVNAKWPNRSKASDGTIGDAKHATRSSDHNPHIKDGSIGVVTAMDITNDPENGPTIKNLSETLRQNKDKRIKYVICDGRIFSSKVSPWKWRKYTGASPHIHHMHVSVRGIKSLYDDRSFWVI